MKRRYSRLLFFSLLVIVFVGGYYLWQEQVVARRPLPEGTRILVKTEYSVCGHEDIKETTPSQVKAATLYDLRLKYPSQEGWRSSREGEQVAVRRTLDNLCEQCSRVTHLAEKGLLDLPDEESLLQVLDSLEEGS